MNVLAAPLVLLLAAGLPVASPSLPPSADPGVAEAVVAVIRSPAAPEPRIITLTRVELEARVALVARGALLAASAPLDAPALRAGLEWTVDQTLLGDEATRLEILEVEPAETEAELRRFRERFARRADYDAFLRRCGLDEAELGALLARTLRVGRYVETRVAHLTAAVDAERGHRPEGSGTADDEAARAKAREQRIAEEAGEEVRALVRDLRARADVRILDDLSGARPR